MDDVKNALRVAKNYKPFDVLPLREDEAGIHFDSNAGALGKMKRAGQYFADTVSGRRQMNVTDPEAIEAANTLAGAATTGSFGASAPAGALRSGMAREQPLMALHTTNIDKLDLARRAQGFPATSTGIVDPRHPFSTFGDISLVGDRSWATPKGEKFRVFQGDPWTPNPLLTDRHADEIAAEVASNPYRIGAQSALAPEQVRAYLTPEFKTFEDVKSKSNLLVSPSKHREYKDLSDEYIHDLKDRMLEHYKGSSISPYSVAHVSMVDPAFRKKNFPNLPSALEEEIAGLPEMVQGAPQSYFESKNYGSANTGESPMSYKGAIVPHHLGPKADKILRDLGITDIYHTDTMDPEKLVRGYEQFRHLQFADGGVAEDHTVKDALNLAQKRPPYSSAIWPVTADDQGLHFDSNAGVLGKAKRAGQYFADTMSGRKHMDVTSPEAIEAANTIAGATTLGAMPFARPAGSLAAGASKIERPPAEPTSYRVDNPGGRWLAEKQEDAYRGTTGTAKKGLRGTPTAFAGMDDEPLMLPVSELSKLRGVNDERRVPGDFQYDDLAKLVDEHGYTNESPVMVFVNHKGQPYVNEGNTRIAVAKDKGIPAIRSWVHWYNGGEDAGGAWSPSAVAEMEQLARSKRASGGSTPSWQRSEGKDPSGGLNAKGRASYNRANPGKPGLKPPAPHPKTDRDAARRESFCSRMKGMKAKLTSSETANDPNSRINKSLRAWNCRAHGGSLMHDDIKYALRLAGRNNYEDGGAPTAMSRPQSEGDGFDLSQFVRSLYQQEFGREGDQGGLDFWTGQLRGQTMTPDQVRQQFQMSPEYNSAPAQQYRQDHMPQYETPYPRGWNPGQGQGGGQPFPQRPPMPMPMPMQGQGGGQPFPQRPPMPMQGQGGGQPMAPWNINDPTGGGPNQQPPRMPFVGKNGGGGSIGGAPGWTPPQPPQGGWGPQWGDNLGPDDRPMPAGGNPQAPQTPNGQPRGNIDPRVMVAMMGGLGGFMK